MTVGRHVGIREKKNINSSIVKSTMHSIIFSRKCKRVAFHFIKSRDIQGTMHSIINYNISTSNRGQEDTYV